MNAMASQINGVSIASQPFVQAQINITWDCIRHCNGQIRTYIRIRVHKRHHIPHFYRQAMGCLLWGSWIEFTSLWWHCIIYYINTQKIIMNSQIGINPSFCTSVPCHSNDMQLYVCLCLSFCCVYFAHVPLISFLNCVLHMSQKCNSSLYNASVDFHQAFHWCVYLMFQKCNSLSYNNSVDFSEAFVCCCYFESAVNCRGEFHVECNLLSN